MTPDAEPRPHGYTAAERRAIAAALARAEAAECPRCGAGLSVQPVDPRPELPYVRRRLWVVCPRCRGTASVDRAPGP